MPVKVMCCKEGIKLICNINVISDNLVIEFYLLFCLSLL